MLKLLENCYLDRRNRASVTTESRRGRQGDRWPQAASLRPVRAEVPHGPTFRRVYAGICPSAFAQAADFCGAAAKRFAARSEP